MSLPPIVLYPLTLPGLLQHILATQSGTTATTLVICSSRDTFLQDLFQSLQHDQSGDQDGSLQDLVTPSLHNLSTMRHIKLAFCASVQALLAYLTVYNHDGLAHGVECEERTRLVLVNPLALHAPTPSFSAQGLSRTFAAATETALKMGAILQVVECQAQHRKHEHQDDEDVGMSNGDEEEHGNEGKHGNEKEEAEEVEEDPWEQEVSILNVSARRFGSNSGERAWAGRTVKVKRIAARWFCFQRLDDGQTREGLG